MPLIEETVFSSFYILVPFFVNDCLFLDSSLPSVCVSVYMSVPYYFDYYSFEIRERETSTFVLLSQGCFGYLGPFVVPYKFQDCSILEKNGRGL